MKITKEEHIVKTIATRIEMNDRERQVMRAIFGELDYDNAIHSVTKKLGHVEKQEVVNLINEFYNGLRE